MAARRDTSERGNSPLRAIAKGSLAVDRKVECSAPKFASTMLSVSSQAMPAPKSRVITAAATEASSGRSPISAGLSTRK